MDIGQWIWVDGQLITVESARVSPLDRGIVVGDGAFETIVVGARGPFAPTRHLARLRRSLGALGLVLDVADHTLREALETVAEVNGERGRRLRLTVTAGANGLGSDRVDGPVTVMIASTAGIERSASTAIVVVPWRRNERGVLVGVKTTSYAENVVALAHAHAAGASEAIFLNTRDEVCEGTGSNIFVVSDGVLVTPPVSSGCLAGITRELILELTPVDERPLELHDVLGASEVFLTSSTRDVQAVHAVDETAFAPAPGPITRKVADLLSDLMRSTPDP